MSPTWTAVLAGLIGLIVGAWSVLAFRASERETMAGVEDDDLDLPSGVTEVLAVLRSAAVVLDTADDVVRASPPAYAFGLVRGDELVHEELRSLAAETRRYGLIRERELELARGPLGRGRFVVHARVAPLGPDHVLVLVEDRTEARRVEEIRRDFVANVSHELKTPVGALRLLAEAVHDAADDPDAVRHFSERMERESLRLTRLVQEIIDLSRLQVADALHPPEPVEVDGVVAEAVDRCRLAAQAKTIDIVVRDDKGAVVFGDRNLLVTAVRNLVDNAIAYSPERTRVGVRVSRGDGLVEVAVSDQGIGIPVGEQSRIFERFYRVDPARSRATGGTGLGLSIVKHVAANHGGDVSVWSLEGQGSTFTLRLPDSAQNPQHAGYHTMPVVPTDPPPLVHLSSTSPPPTASTAPSTASTASATSAASSSSSSSSSASSSSASSSSSPSSSSATTSAPPSSPSPTAPDNASRILRRPDQSGSQMPASN